MASKGRAAVRRQWDESIIVALGGNLAGGEAALRSRLEAALAMLPEQGLLVVQRSRYWRSAAWPNPDDPPFLNAVALVETSLDPVQTMAALHRLETLFGRTREALNAPRTLDLDLVAFGRRICTGPLILPHPRAAQRRFVMGPLAELAPDWRHPVTGERAADLAASAPIASDAKPLPLDPPGLQSSPASLI